MTIARRHFTLPPVVNGATLDDVFSVIIPAGRTNEISNPSLETNTTGYTAGAGSLARSTAQQYYGAYSAAYTPSAATTDGFYYTFTSTVALRAVSCKFLGVRGYPYALAYATTAPVELVTYPFTATGRWQWIWLYVNETSATSRRIYFRKNNSANVLPYYVDGVQSETLTDASQTVSTYLDGDQLGLVPNQQPPAYWWNGTPHASTSTRSSLTRAGGQVRCFKDYGLLLSAITGLGLAPPQNVAMEYARLDGGFDDYTRKPTRQFTLVTRISGRNYMDLRAMRSAIADSLDRDLSAQDQRLILLHSIVNQQGVPQTNLSRIPAKYVAGFAGNTDNGYAETVPLTFTNYQPAVQADAESGASLAVQQNVSNANYIQVLDTATGLWSAVSTGTVAGASGDVNAIVVGPDGKVYIGGAFTTASGVANTSRICYYDPADGLMHAMGTGALNNSVVYMAIAPNGNLYVAGSFTQMGGVANTNNIAMWNGAAWSALGTGVTTGAGILAMAVDSQGNLYVGGTFTQMGGVANTTRLAKWNGAAWSALGTGADNTVRALAVGSGDILFIGGDFANVNATACAFIAKWNGTAASPLSTGMDNSVRCLALGTNGFVYAGGDFTLAGGVAAAHVAQWNGVAWTAMGSGFTTHVDVLTVMPDGTVWEGGASTSGTVAMRSPLAKWTGTNWVSSDNNLVSTVTVQAITPDRGSKLYVGYSSFGTAIQAGLTTITNIGTARSYPVLYITGATAGSGRIFELHNWTTNRVVYFNLTLNVGENATIVLTPDALSFSTQFRPNIASTVLPGSNEADCFLQNGANVIGVLAAGSTTTATIRWRPFYLSLDDVP